MKMYLTTAEAQARGLPSVDEQIERYNQAVRAERSPRTVSCGCCAGIGADPNRDRCTCHFHQDTPRGIPPHVCAYHEAHGHPHVTSEAA